MTTTTQPNRTSTAAKDGQVILGINKDLQTMSSILLGGQTFSSSSLAARIQSRIDAWNAVVTAKANWQNAAKTYDAIDATTTVIVRELRNLVIGAFGADSPKLADFGFAPTTRAPLTSEEKAVKAAKARATRLARGTTSKKQKATIHGVLPTAAPAAPTAPATAPVASSPAPAPAPVAQAPAPTTPAVAAPVAPVTPAPAPAPHS
jgi:hypothetical protein